MNSMIFRLSLVVSFILVSCSGSKKAAIKTPLSGDMTFNIWVDDSPFAGIEVSYKNLRRGSSTTDNEGQCKLLTTQEEKGKIMEVELLNSFWGIDTVVSILIQSPITIHLNLPKKAGKFVEGRMQELNKKIVDLSSDLTKAQNAINKMNADMTAYLKKYPDSALDDYRVVIKYREAELKTIKKAFVNLKNDFNDVVAGWKDSELMDLDDYESIALELSELYLQTDLIEEEKDKVIGDINLTNSALRDNLEVNPDFKINSDIFFERGDWQLDELTSQQLMKLDAFPDKINKLRDDSYAYYKVEDLMLHVKTIGYTDGVLVSTELYNKIIPLCQEIPHSENDKGNYCLSNLRAESVLNHIVHNLPPTNLKQESEGRGSILAQGKTNDNPNIRKCYLTFSLMPLKITESKQKENVSVDANASALNKK